MMVAVVTVVIQDGMEVADCFGSFWELLKTSPPSIPTSIGLGLTDISLGALCVF